VHVDPYVYVDPSWEYADWFEVQTTSDGVEWLAVKRTTIDLSTFGLEGGNGLPDGGVPDPDAPRMVTAEAAPSRSCRPHPDRSWRLWRFWSRWP